MTVEAVVAEHRDRLFGLAYRMLGSVAEAEDVVQESLVRYAQADGVDEPGAWLTTVATRLCLDVLRSARVRREEYVGPWLPEPLVAERHERGPEDVAVEADSLTLAFLVVLESLSPAERAVFLLHDVFGHPHAEIARMLDRTPEAIRKLASRARSHLDARRPRFDADPRRRWEIAEAFLGACVGGDVGEVVKLLAPDVVWIGDGGGEVTSARRPIEGADNVARFALGLMAQAGEGWSVGWAEVNGMPGVVVRHRGEVDSVLALDVLDGRVVAVHNVRNPAKLRHLARGR